MKVLMINPPLRKGSREWIRAGSRWPHTTEKLTENSTIPFPFFLAYCVSLLRENNFEAELIDGVACRMEPDDFFKRLDESRADLIVFETSTPTYEFDREIFKEISEKFPNAKLLFSGTHPSVFPEKVLSENPFLDFVAIGEYEMTILELAVAIKGGGDLRKVAGLGFRKNGDIIINSKRELISDLDVLPYPFRDKDAIYFYNDWFCKYRPNVQLLSSRGCIFGCPFCVFPRVFYRARNWRARKPERVVDEIESILSEFDFKEFYFDDDTTNIRIEHVSKICEEIIKRKLKIRWSFMGHVGNIDKDFLELFRKSGGEGIKFGIETGNEKILKSLKKGITLNKCREVFKWCKELGIRTHATFTFGLPGETRDTVRQTIDFLLELDPTTMQVSIVTPLPGSELYETAKKDNLLLTEDWRYYDGSHTSVLRTESLAPEDLEDAYRSALDAWNKRQFKRNVVQNPLKYFCRAVVHPFRAMKTFYEVWVKR